MWNKGVGGEVSPTAGSGSPLKAGLCISLTPPPPALSFLAVRRTLKSGLSEELVQALGLAQSASVAV